MKVKCNVTQCEYNKSKTCQKDNIEINFSCDEYDYAYCTNYVESKKAISNKYYIEKLNENDFNADFFIIINTSDTGFDYIEYILDDIKSITKEKDITIIFDHLLHNGDSSNRFIIAKYKIYDNLYNPMVIPTQLESKLLNIPKKNIIREISCNYFKTKPNLIEYSILNSVQKKMILKGIVI